LDNIFDTGRNVYQIDINNLITSDTADITLQFINSSGSVLTASNYNSSLVATQITNTRVQTGVNMGTASTILKTKSTMAANAQLLIFNPANTSLTTKGIIVSANIEGSTGMGFATGGFEYNASDGLRGIRINTSAGTFSDCDLSCSVLATESAG
tara:strand:+ start:512 stop:973 length:462 start_codon:yes stop_codon:yes gene_type:complete